MGSYSEEPEFKTLTIKPLHPTFGAEVEGVNFQNLSDEQFQEIFAAMAKVSLSSQPRNTMPRSLMTHPPSRRNIPSCLSKSQESRIKNPVD